MTDPPSDAGAPSNVPRPLSYASALPGSGASRLATIALAGSLSFPALVLIGAAVHPDIPAALLLAMVAFPVVGVVLGLVARKSKPAARGRRRAKATVWVGGIELGLIVVVSVLLPTLCRPRETAKRVECASNLRQIGLALAQYADRHDGRFPLSLAELLGDPQTDLAADVFVCPSSDDERAPGATAAEQAGNLRPDSRFLSYVYTGAGLSSASITPECVLAYEHPGNHKNGGLNILFGDGHVEFLSRQASETLTAELRAGHNPPRTSHKR